MWQSRRILKLVLALVTAGLLAGCAQREVEVQETAPNQIIKIDHSLRMKQGRDIPDHLCPMDDLLKYAPSEAKVVGRVFRGDSSSKFTLSMTWTFTGSSPAFWRIYPFSDPNDRSGELIPGDRITPGGDGIAPRDRFSSELDRGRIYKFELVAQVDCYKGTGNSIVEGLLVMKTITVDLRGL